MSSSKARDNRQWQPLNDSIAKLPNIPIVLIESDDNGRELTIDHRPFFNITSDNDLDETTPETHITQLIIFDGYLTRINPLNIKTWPKKYSMLSDINVFAVIDSGISLRQLGEWYPFDFLPDGSIRTTRLPRGWPAPLILIDGRFTYRMWRDRVILCGDIGMATFRDNKNLKVRSVADTVAWHGHRFGQKLVLKNEGDTVWQASDFFVAKRVLKLIESVTSLYTVRLPTEYDNPPVMSGAVAAPGVSDNETSRQPARRLMSKDGKGGKTDDISPILTESMELAEPPASSRLRKGKQHQQPGDSERGDDERLLPNPAASDTPQEKIVMKSRKKGKGKGKDKTGASAPAEPMQLTEQPPHPRASSSSHQKQQRNDSSLFNQNPHLSAPGSRPRTPSDVYHSSGYDSSGSRKRERPQYSSDSDSVSSSLRYRRRPKDVYDVEALYSPSPPRVPEGSAVAQEQRLREELLPDIGLSVTIRMREGLHRLSASVTADSREAQVITLMDNLMRDLGTVLSDMATSSVKFPEEVSEDIRRVSGWAEQMRETVGVTDHFEEELQAAKE